MIKEKGKYDSKTLTQIEEYEKTVADIQQKAAEFEEFKNKKNIEKYLNSFVLSSLIPPAIEVRNLTLVKTEDNPIQFYGSFIHCEKKWRLYLTENNKNFLFWFSIEGLRKDEVSIKITLELVHPTTPGKNIVTYQNFNIAKVNDKPSMERITNFSLREQYLKEFSHGTTENIILKINFKFQYDFFTSFINDIEN